MHESSATVPVLVPPPQLRLFGASTALLTAAARQLSWITVSTADARHECLLSGFPPPPWSSISLENNTNTNTRPPTTTTFLSPMTFDPPNILSSGPNHHTRSAWLTPTLLWRNRNYETSDT
ncbi:hypothetical protein INR49_004531 [Caranx melampygus]|nr:hypothetical protein INR49_004531 [Caranx melampygus]